MLFPITEPLSITQPQSMEISCRPSTPCVGRTGNPAIYYIESLGSAVSKRSMISPLNRVAGIYDTTAVGSDAWKRVPWHLIAAGDVKFIMSQISGSPATRNKALAALKGVARCAWELSILSTEHWTRIRSIKGDSGTREMAGRYVPTGELTMLLKACAEDPSSAGARDGAMITLAAHSGVRRAELAGMLIEMTQLLEPGTIAIRLIGKRNKERTIYATGNAEKTLKDWIAVRGSGPGPIFSRIRKDGKILVGEGITPTALDRILRKRSSQAYVKDIDWHDLRRTNASNLLDAGADIAVVARILGHANVQTTARYDRRGERAKMRVAELISVPYFAREHPGVLQQVAMKPHAEIPPLQEAKPPTKRSKEKSSTNIFPQSTSIGI